MWYNKSSIATLPCKSVGAAVNQETSQAHKTQIAAQRRRKWHTKVWNFNMQLCIGTCVTVNTRSKINQSTV